MRRKKTEISFLPTLYIIPSTTIPKKFKSNSIKYFVLAILLLTAGCLPLIPEHKTALPKRLAVDDIHRQIEDYNSKIDTDVECINSVVFSYRGGSFVTIGPLKLNEPADSFSMAALNPMGMRLFQVKVTNSEVEKAWVLPQFKEAEKTVQAVKTDIERIYFNRDVDLESAKVRQSGAVSATVEKNGGICKYAFSGVPLRLISKRFYREGRKVWSADYYDYLPDSGGRIFPWKTFFKHYVYRYTLAITTKNTNEQK